MRRVVLGLLAVTVVIAAAGAYLLTRFEGPPKDSTAALVPLDATVYVSFFVGPSSDQKKLLRDRVEEAGPDLDAASLIETILDRVTRAYGLPFEDVSPWIGRQMAVFATPRRGGAVIAEVADVAAARAVIDRVDGRLLGSHAVFGDPGAVRAVAEIHEKGPASPSEGGPFVTPDAFALVPEDRLAFGSVKSGLTDLPPELDAIELLVGMGPGNVVALRATEDGFVFDGFSGSDGAFLLLNGQDAPYFELGSADGNASVAAILPNLSAAIDGLERELARVHRLGSVPIRGLGLTEALDGTDQILVWLGGRDLGSLSAGLKATTDGKAAMARLARALAALPAFEPTFEFRPNRLLARFGPDGGRLADDGRFEEATGWLGDLIPIGYLDMDGARPLMAVAAAAAGLGVPQWFTDVDRVAVGIDGEVAPTHWRVVVSLKR